MMNYLTDLRPEKPKELELPPNATSLDLLRAIYRNPHAELTMRIRCAMACLQFEHAKLGVTVQVSEQGFAELLDRRLKKLAAMEQNGSKAIAIDGPKPEVEIRPPMPRIADRRYRRF
jgi:predicted DNA-binding protein (UPF0251 family)